MKKIALLLLITINFAYSQDIEKIKKSDTIYILNERCEFNRKSTFFNKKDDFVETWFNIIYYDINKTQVFLNFNQYKFLYFDREINKISKKQIVSKEFLRKIKEKTITIEFLRKLSYKDIKCTIFKVSKVIYLIDAIDEKKGKMPMFEVMVMDFCNIEDD